MKPEDLKNHIGKSVCVKWIHNPLVGKLISFTDESAEVKIDGYKKSTIFDIEDVSFLPASPKFLSGNIYRDDDQLATADTSIKIEIPKSLNNAIESILINQPHFGYSDVRCFMIHATLEKLEKMNQNS